MTTRGPLGKLAAFVGYSWGLMLAFVPLLDVARTATVWAPGRTLVVASWVVGLGSAYALLRFRPSVRVDTTWLFGIVTVLVTSLLEALGPAAGSRLIGSAYPPLVLGLHWTAAVLLAYVLTFGDGWRDAKRGLRSAD